MPQTTCSLNGTAFLYNAPSQKNPAPKSVQHVTTLGGGYDTVWGIFAQDRVITLSWPVLNYASYKVLEAIKNLLAPMPFVDWEGVNWTVLVLDLTHESVLRGGLDAYVNVAMTLRVVSQP